VILTTHSAEFVRSTNPNLHVIRVEKTETGTAARPLDIAEFRQFFLSPGQNELFFAEAAIICEGDDEHLIRIVAEQKYPGKLDQLNVSVVRAGGKDGIITLSKLVLRLGIKCFILSDFDFLLRDKEVTAEQYHAKKHASVLNLPAEWFSQTCTFAGSGPKVPSRLHKLRLEIKENGQEAFYKAKALTEISDPTARIRSAISKCRQHGLGLLSGEIEDTILGEQILVDKKFTFESARRLHVELESGQQLDSLVETSEICELLDRVFDKCATAQRKTTGKTRSAGESRQNAPERQ
jgi:putative ATP-dependent endonuclease of OLD family